MTSQQAEALEHRAYREAGHAVMSYLIRKGYTDQYVPIDRSRILPAFKAVAIEGQSANWDERTLSLGSLVTVAQVLLAGDVAERIKYNVQNEQFPPNTVAGKQALHLTTSYVEEYGRDEMSIADRDHQALELLDEMVQYVEDRLRFHWASLEALVAALLENKMLSESNAFEIIERDIPPDAKAKAEAIINQDPHEAMMAAFEEMRKELRARKSGASSEQSSPIE